MNNPYDAPKARVADVTELPLPLGVRVLRGVAVFADVALAALPVLVFVSIPPKYRGEWFFMTFSAGAYFVAASSICVLIARSTARWVHRSAIFANGLALVVLVLLFYWRGPNPYFGSVFIVPALLNIAALEALRRERR